MRVSLLNSGGRIWSTRGAPELWGYGVTTMPTSPEAGQIELLSNGDVARHGTAYQRGQTRRLAN